MINRFGDTTASIPLDTIISNINEGIHDSIRDKLISNFKEKLLPEIDKCIEEEVDKIMLHIKQRLIHSYRIESDQIMLLLQINNEIIKEIK